MKFLSGCALSLRFARGGRVNLVGLDNLIDPFRSEFKHQSLQVGRASDHVFSHLHCLPAQQLLKSCREIVRGAQAHPHCEHEHEHYAELETRHLQSSLPATKSPSSRLAVIM